MGHIDDSLLLAQHYEDCEANINDTVHIFTKLGFVVHPEKSILKPIQEIEFLGLIINSLTMSVRLSASKSAKMQAACKKLLQSEHISIRNVAHVQYGELYCRKLEIDQSFALRQNQGDFDAPMTLSDNSKSELLWWIANLPAHIDLLFRLTRT